MSGDAISRITLAAGADRVGLSVMIADLVRQNLARNPRKQGDFDKLDTEISLEAPDADVAITLVFSRGRLSIHEGIFGAPKIRISAGAHTLLALPMAKITMGIPNLFHHDSRALLKGFITGAVKISGMYRRPIQLVRFTRLLSVND
jgi:hypothetical protein